MVIFKLCSDVSVFDTERFLFFLGVGLYVLYVRSNEKVPTVLEISLEKVS